MANSFQSKELIKSSTNTKYSLDTIFNFGKYVKDQDLRNKDGSIKTLREIIDIDPNYIDWCISNIDSFDIDQEADNYFQEISSEEQDPEERYWEGITTWLERDSDCGRDY